MRFGLLVAAVQAVIAPAAADIGGNDVTIAARALGFLDRPPTGIVRVGIVAARDNPRSAEDAASLQAIMNSGLKVGGLSLKPVIVSLDAVGGADVDLLFLTGGLGAAGSKAGDVARTKRIPCVTLDIDQVRDGNCAIGIRSEPRVEILVNRDVAARSGVSFAGAFKMLITEF